MPTIRAHSADRSSVFSRSMYESSSSSGSNTEISSKKLTTKIVDRIRRLSPAALGWRRRSSDQHKLLNDKNNVPVSLPMQTKRSQSTSDLNVALMNFTKVDHSFFCDTNPMYLSQNALQIDQISDSQSWNIKDLVELQVPDSKVWQLRRQYPKTFINLVLAYIRNAELSMEDFENLTNLIRDICESEDLITNPRTILTRKRRRQPNDSWFIVINAMLHYLLEGDRYSKKFILRRPGNQIHINDLENQLTNLMKDSKRNDLQVSDVNAILASFDVSVIACTMSRILRRNRPLFPDVIKTLLLQLCQGRNEALTSNEWCRVQRKSVRLLLLFQSRKMRSLVLRPLFRLFAKISLDPLCEVEESSLAILFAPIFFVESTQQVSDPKSLTDPKLAQAAERIVRLCRHEMESQNSVNTLFKLPKLFMKDVTRNLIANLAAKTKGEEVPPLYSSMTYCTNITQQSPAKNLNNALTTSNKLNASQILSVDTSDSGGSTESPPSILSSEKLFWSQAAFSGNQMDPVDFSASPLFDGISDSNTYRYNLVDPVAIHDLSSDRTPCLKRSRAVLTPFHPSPSLRESPCFDSRIRPVRADWDFNLSNKRPSSVRLSNEYLDDTHTVRLAKRPSIRTTPSCVSLDSNIENFPPASPIINSTNGQIATGLDRYMTPIIKPTLMDFKVKRRTSFVESNKYCESKESVVQLSPSPVFGKNGKLHPVADSIMLNNKQNLIRRNPFTFNVKMNKPLMPRTLNYFVQNTDL